MHTLPLVVMTVVLGVLAPSASGQETSGMAHDGATADDATLASPAHVGAQAASADASAGPRNGFGQVMALLTGLLADAAQREASGDDAGFALDNPAVVVSVTPVQGTDSFLRGDASTAPGNNEDHDGPRDAPRRDTANARLAAEPAHPAGAMPR